MTDSDQSTRARYRHLVLLLLILGVATALRVYEFRGFGASDDSAYAEIAGRLARGEAIIGAYEGPGVVPLRMGIIAPTAVLYRFFGVASWTLVGFVFASSLLGVLLAYAAARHFFDARAGLAAAALWALLPIDAFQASILAPDLPAALSLGAAILIVVWLLDSDGGGARRYFGGGTVAGLLLGYSWLCKETLAYAAPFFLFLIVYERRRLAELWPVWVGVAVGSGGVLVAEGFVYFRATGDWLHHLSETQRTYEQYPVSFAVQRPGDEGSYLRAVIKRIAYTGPWTILLNPRLGYLPLLGGVAAVHAAVRMDRRFLVPSVWLLSLAFMFNFASSSLTEYVPLLLFDRYLYPLLLPATVLLAGFLVWPLEDRGATVAALRRERAFWSVAALTFFVISSAWQNRENRFFSPSGTAEVATVAELLQPEDRIYTDARSIFGLDFNWSYPETLNTVNFEGMESAEVIPSGSYVLVNQAYLDQLTSFSGWWPTTTNPYARPPFADTPPSSWEVAWSGGAVTLYEVR